MTTFGLVHGAWHGAWCWDRLVLELEQLGHEATRMDLPCDDPTATFSTYADVIVEALQDVPEDLVLVAHSLGGLSMPIAAARLPARALVFLCALLPQPGRSLADQLRDEPDLLLPHYTAGIGPADDQGRRAWADPELAVETFYADCDPDDARSAADQLRPQALTPYGEPCPLDALPHLPTAYLLATEDRIVNPAWSRRAVPERLDVEAIELQGSSHSPFLSRPAELAKLLVDLT